MLNRSKIILKCREAKTKIRTESWLTDCDEEELACLNTLIDAVKDQDRSDQNIDDLAFSMGLDSHLYWGFE